MLDGGQLNFHANIPTSSLICLKTMPKARAKALEVVAIVGDSWAATAFAEADLLIALGSIKTRFEAPARRCKLVVRVVSRFLIAQWREWGGALLLCRPLVVVLLSCWSSIKKSSVDCSSLSPSSDPSSSCWLESPVSSSLIRTKLDKPIMAVQKRQRRETLLLKLTQKLDSQRECRTTKL